MPCVYGCGASEPAAAPDPLVGTSEILHKSVAPAISRDPRLTDYLNEMGNRLVTQPRLRRRIRDGKPAPRPLRFTW